MMSLKVGYEFSLCYHDLQDGPLDILLLGSNGFQHLAYEIYKFLNFVFLMCEYWAHRFVSNI